MKLKSVSIALMVSGISALAWYSAGCGSSTTASGPNTYTTSSSTGDFGVWTVQAGGSFTLKWTQTDSTGAAAATINVSGSCGAADATYAYYTCTISTSDTPASAPVGGKFDLLEIPGVALIVHPHDSSTRRGGSGGNDEIHVGFLSAGCVNGKGTYSYINTVPATAQGSAQSYFGVYSKNDSSFTSVSHLDFGLAQNGTGFKTQYNSGNANKGVESLGCCRSEIIF